MEALAEFELLRPTTLAGVLEARSAHPQAQLLGGGTDLIVNLRRGIVAPPVLIDMNGVAELRTIRADAKALEIGASVTLAEVAHHPGVHRALSGGGAGGRLDRRADASQHGHRRRQPVPRYALHLLQPEPMVALAPTTTASRPPATSATWRRRAAACASPPSAATWRRR